MQEPGKSFNDEYFLVTPQSHFVIMLGHNPRRHKVQFLYTTSVCVYDSITSSAHFGSGLTATDFVLELQIQK